MSRRHLFGAGVCAVLGSVVALAWLRFDVGFDKLQSLPSIGQSNLQVAVWPFSLIAIGSQARIEDSLVFWGVLVALNGLAYGLLGFLWGVRGQARIPLRSLISLGIGAWWIVLLKLYLELRSV